MKEQALQKELETELQDLKEALVLVRDYKINSVGSDGHEESLAFAEESRALTKGQWKKYEDKRTAATKPLNKALKEINSWFKPVQTILKNMEDAWNQKLKEVLMEARRVQEEKIAEARLSEAPDIIKESLVEAADSVLVPETVKFRDRWVFQIVDPSIIPREFLMPDEKKIGGVVSALKEDHGIPGIKAWNDPIVSGPTK